MAQTPNPSYALRNAAAEAAANPDSFPIPPVAECAALSIGDHAKLVVETNRATESLWVTIVGRFRDAEGGTSYVGSLPKTLASLSLPTGHKVIFRPEHVCGIRPTGE